MPWSVRAEGDRRLAGQDAGAGLEPGPRPRTASTSSRAARTARSASSSWATGRAPDGHDRVADELLDGAAVALDDVARELEVRGSAARGPPRRRGPRTSVGEADEVGEQDGDEPPLGDGSAGAWRRPRRPGGRATGRDRGAAPRQAAPRPRARSRTRRRTAPSGGFAAPQLGHAAASLVPHSWQNLRPASLTVPQAGHCIRGVAVVRIRGLASPAPGAPSAARVSRAAPGCRRPRRRTRSRAARASPRRRTRRRGRCRSIAHSSGSVSPIGSTAFAYSSDSVMSDTVVSSVESVTGTPARCRRASGWAASDGHDRRPASSRSGTGRASTPRSRSSAHSAGSSTAPGPVGDPLRVHRERAADLRRAAPLAGVERDPQAAGPRRLERARRGAAGSGKRRLRPGEVPAGQALVAESGRGLGKDRRSRRGRASAAPCR